MQYVKVKHLNLGEKTARGNSLQAARFRGKTPGGLRMRVSSDAQEGAGDRVSFNSITTEAAREACICEGWQDRLQSLVMFLSMLCLISTRVMMLQGSEKP